VDDAVAQVIDRPVGREQLEVERQVQLALADVAGQPVVVGHPHLADRHRARVLVEHRADPAVQGVHALLVEPQVAGPVVGQQAGVLHRHHVGQPVRLGHPVRDVDAEAVHPAVQPEPHRVLQVGDDLRVGEVEVGLLRREQVQVPLAVGNPGPGGSAEDGVPVVRRLVPIGSPAVAEHVPRPFRRAGTGGQRLLEPRPPVRAVVRHEVDRHLEAERMSLGQHRVELPEVPEDRLHVPRIGDVVAVVGHGGGVERRDPDRLHAEGGEIGQPVADARQVADAVTTPVGEAADVDLVEDRLAPPPW
jgi:hypothetical protein